MFQLRKSLLYIRYIVSKAKWILGQQIGLGTLQQCGQRMCLVLASAAALMSHPRCAFIPWSSSLLISLAKLSLTKDTLSLGHAMHVTLLMLTPTCLMHSHLLTSWLDHSRVRVLHGLGCFCWRRQWHPTPALLPGKSHGWRSLVGCSPWGR